jgi:opacity protein-like surface antigen
MTGLRLALALGLSITGAAPAAAQQGTAAQREPWASTSAHLQFGRLSQTASDSFTAILGRSSGLVFGGGAELSWRSGLFVRGDVSYFSADGERAEIVDGEVIPLEIPLSISLTPIEFTGGYRLPEYTVGPRRQVRLVPFIGAGAGFVRFREHTDDEHPEESADERFASYHLLLGLDVPLAGRFALGAELTRRWVPGGLGTSGVSQVLGESDLGGSTLRARVRVTF